MLQCGHDPEAVENSDTAGLVVDGIRLQCGHDPEAVESRLSLTGSDKPAWLQCGHDPEAVESRRVQPGDGRKAKLQCGHDPEAVERRIGKVGATWLEEASMRPRPGGRGEPRPSGCAPVGDGFNAATTRRPWRDERQEGEILSLDRLQCGHDPEAVENRSGDKGDRLTTASMRPRPGGRGERGLAGRCSTTKFRRFNAATTRRPWRAANGTLT